MPSQSLEQEALDRVARMYSSYDRQRRQRPPQPVAKPEPEAPPSAPEKKSEPNAENTEEKPTGLLDVLLRDKEQSLIMLLLVILMKDGADMNTILALMYLLL